MRVVGGLRGLGEGKRRGGEEAPRCVLWSADGKGCFAVGGCGS